MPQRREHRESNFSNRELFEHVDLALDCFEKSLQRLERQQKELTERIAFIAPTESDIRQEVESFINGSLAT